MLTCCQQKGSVYGIKFHLASCANINKYIYLSDRYRGKFNRSYMSLCNYSASNQIFSCIFIDVIIIFNTPGKVIPDIYSGRL